VLTGWPTPQRADALRGAETLETKAARGAGGLNLSDASRLVGWVTPAGRDWKDTPGMATTGVNPDGSRRKRLDQLPRKATQVRGASSSQSPSSTAPRGVLNPALSRWLMGYRAVWDRAAPGQSDYDWWQRRLTARHGSLGMGTR